MASKRDTLAASAEKLLAKGKVDAALKEYLKILEDPPLDINILNKVGDLFVRLNRNEESIPYFSRIAEHYSRDGFFLKSIAIYKKINKLDPSRLDVYERLAELYGKQGLGMEAKSQYQVLADYYTKQDNLLGAVAIYQKMSAAEPANIQLHVKLADLFTQAKRVPDALKEYGAVAQMLGERGALDESSAVYEKALRLAPDNLEILRTFVPSLMAAGKVEHARVVLRRALETTPRSVPLFLMAAEAASAVNDMAEARSLLAKARTVEPSNEEVLAAIIRVQLKGRRPDLAFEAALHLVDFSVRRGEAKRALAILVPVAKMAADHEDILRKTVEMASAAGDEPASLPFRAQLADIYRKKGRIPEAAEQLKACAQIAPDVVEYRARLAQLEPQLPSAPPREDVRSDREITLSGIQRAPAVKPPPSPPAHPRSSSVHPRMNSNEFEFTLDDADLVEEAVEELGHPATPTVPSSGRSPVVEETRPGFQLPKTDFMAPAISEQGAAPTDEWYGASANDAIARYEAKEKEQPAADARAAIPGAPPSAFAAPSPESLTPPGGTPVHPPRAAEELLGLDAMPEFPAPPPAGPAAGAVASPPPLGSDFGIDVEPPSGPVQATSQASPPAVQGGGLGDFSEVPLELSALEDWAAGDAMGATMPANVPPAKPLAPPPPPPVDEPIAAEVRPEPAAPPVAPTGEPIPAPPPAGLDDLSFGDAVSPSFTVELAPPAVAETPLAAEPRAEMPPPVAPPAAAPIEMLPVEVPAEEPAPEEAPPALVGEAPPRPVPVPPVLVSAAIDTETEEVLVEAEVFRKYGLLEKAGEQLKGFLRARPDVHRVREKLFEILLEQGKKVAARREAETLKDVYRSEGRDDRVRALDTLLGEAVDVASLTSLAPESPKAPKPLREIQIPMPEPPASRPSRAAASPPKIELPDLLGKPAKPSRPAAAKEDPGQSALASLEADLKKPREAPPKPAPKAERDLLADIRAKSTPAPAPLSGPSSEDGRLADQLARIDFCLDQGMVVDAAEKIQALETRFPGDPLVQARRTRLEGAGRPPAEEARPALQDLLSEDLEQVLDAELGRALTDEMARGAKAAPSSLRPPEASPAGVDESGLFSDEQEFFNLAEQLRTEMKDAPGLPDEPDMQGGGKEVSLEEIFREFKKGVEQQLSPEDYETHYNLGIAYKEMGLTDEAIGEFQLASKDPLHAVECCSMLGLCFLEKGLPQLAIKWYRKGLEAIGIREDDRLGLQYDLANVYIEVGDRENAYKTFLDIYGSNAHYRDVGDRLKELAPA